MTDLNHTELSAMLSSHQVALTQKGIRNEATLEQILCADLEKVLHAFEEARNVPVDRLLTQYCFPGQTALLARVSSHVTGQKLCHMGFEIFEPLDLVLQNISLWEKCLSAAFTADIRLQRHIRFPASGAFQNRVQAFVEIMGMEFCVPEGSVTLELFDIANVLQQLPEVIPDFRLPSAQPVQAIRHWFGNDGIWHYSVPVASREAVLDLHEQFCKLPAGQYRRAYASPVDNRHDGSFHTKLIRLDRRLEVEFCYLKPVAQIQKS